MQKKLIFSLFLLCLLGLQAQQPFGSISYSQFVSSAHFDVYFHGNHEAEATLVAKYAEMAKGELGYLYDYKPQSRYKLIYIPHYQQFLYSNLSDIQTPTVSGDIQLPRLDACVIMPSTQALLYATVKQQVSALMLKEFDYGKDLPDLIQTELLNYKPQWFYDGVTEYVATGWTYEDEQRLQGFAPEKLLLETLTGNAPMNVTLRKSVWFYIAHEYGPQKFAELLYLSKISRSVETAIMSVIGVKLSTFSERWREFTIQKISVLKAGRNDVADSENVKKISLKKGYQCESYALSGNGKKVAMWLDKKGKQSLWIWDVETETYESTGIESGYVTPLAHADTRTNPIGIRKDGSLVLTTVWGPDGWKWAMYEIETGISTYFSPDSSLARVFHISFSNGGNKVALSAIKNGMQDILIGDAERLIFKNITNDMYNDTHPSWSFDDQQLLFASNRSTRLLKSPVTSWDYFKQKNDLFAYNLEDKTDTLLQLTATPTIDEQAPFAPNSYEVFYLSEESGLWDLHKTNIFQETSAFLSKYTLGFQNICMTETHMVFQMWESGTMHIYYASLPENELSAPVFTDFRKEFLSEWERKNQPISDPIISNTSTSDSIPAPAPTVTQPLRYYIFDDDIEDNYAHKPEKPSTAPVTKPQSKSYIQYLEARKQPEWNKLNVARAQKAPNQWHSPLLHLGFTYHPVTKFGVELGAMWEDMQKHHRLSGYVTPYFSLLPVINFQQSDTRIRYTYRKIRPDFYVEAGGQQRIYRRENLFFGNVMDSIAFRFGQIRLAGGVTYPLSLFGQLGAEAAFYHLTQTDIKLLNNPAPQNDKNTMMGLLLYYQHQHIQYLENYPLKGAKYYIGIQSLNSLQKKEASFSTITFQAQRYLPVYKHIVFAANFQSKLSFGKRQTFYMGGVDNWITGVLAKDRPGRASYTGLLSTDITDFSFHEFVTPIRGFRYNARNGTRYMAANLELRIPLSRIRALNKNQLINWELIPFLDAGTVWRRGNPFSQKNPTDLQVIYGTPVIVELQTLKSPFLVGFGTGIKTQVLNYTVRADMGWGVDDYTLQKPQVVIAVGRAF